jgi:hypothetical protein
MTDTIHPSIHDQAEALLARLASGEADECFDADSFVHQLLAHSKQIAAIWSVEDVQGTRPHLTADQAWEVLQEVGDNHDAEWGISWTTLETVADDMFPAPDTDDAEEED